MTFGEILQSYVNLSYDQLVGLGGTSLSQAIPALEKYLQEKERVAQFLLILVGTCLGADGQLTSREAAYINDVMGTTVAYNDLLSATNACNDAESRELIDNIVDSLDQDAKTAICSFCICVMSVDQTISRPEVEFISKLLG